MKSHREEFLRYPAPACDSKIKTAKRIGARYSASFIGSWREQRFPHSAVAERPAEFSNTWRQSMPVRVSPSGAKERPMAEFPADILKPRDRLSFEFTLRDHPTGLSLESRLRIRRIIRSFCSGLLSATSNASATMAFSPTRGSLFGLNNRPLRRRYSRNSKEPIRLL